jgi:hypothetical protein
MKGVNTHQLGKVHRILDLKRLPFANLQQNDLLFILSSFASILLLWLPCCYNGLPNIPTYEGANKDIHIHTY